MKRLLLCVVGVGALGCGKSELARKSTAAPAKSVDYFHVDAATAGTISGSIVFRGAQPKRQIISMDADEACQQAHAASPAYNEPVLTGAKGGLANAFVYIQAGLEDKKFEPPKESVSIDQNGCLFLPPVIGVRAGQPLEMKNSDRVSHNIHFMPVNNREWNEQQSPGTPDVEHRFVRPEVMIPVKCNVHAWMHAWVGVVDNPYFAVTGPTGAFTLSNVPPGDYTIAVWHEKLGQQNRQVHLDASGKAVVTFIYR